MKNQWFGIEKEYRNWILISIVLIFFLGINIHFIHENFVLQNSIHNQYELEMFDSRAKTIITTYEQFSNYIYSEVINQPEILKIVQLANSADEANKNDLRHQLYNILEDDYALIAYYNFRQLHFHLPDGESFLRFHSPENFGDNIQDIRESIRIANIEKRYVSGFEEGRVLNGYRFVYPLFIDTEHIGSVEISIAMTTVITILADLYPDVDNYFIVDKSTVDNLVFSEKSDQYIESFISDQFYFDREVDRLSQIHNEFLSIEEQKELFTQAHEKYKDLLKSKDSFIHKEIFKGNHYQIKFLSIKNISGLPSGYFVSLSSDPQLELLIRHERIDIILASAITFMFLISSFIFTYYHVKVKKIMGIDFLTKSFNRQKFMEILSLEMSRSKRYGKPFSILLLDIDHFKSINDKHGHATGDEVLKTISTLVSKNLRESDTFARWGGEEFICLLPETNLVDGVKVAEKLNTMIKEHGFDSIVDNVTVSIGVSVKSSQDKSIDQIIEMADQALYQAKRDGRNQVKPFDPD